MKNILLTFLLLSISLNLVNASVPTEEGLLKNLNNSDLPGQYIVLKTMIQTSTDVEKTEYVKFQIYSDGQGPISILQSIYSNGQMQNAQLKNVKFIPDVVSYLKKEKSAEKSIFSSILVFLTTNRSLSFEVFLEKNGVAIVKNKTILNDEKIRLLRQYRSHLVNSKGKSDAGSPLNPEDPKAKERVLELFRSNTFRRAKNIELIKRENEFVWKVDWKFAQGYFSNEERRFRALDYTANEQTIKIEANNYLLFNGVNEMPKFINLKDTLGQIYKIQTLGLDIKKQDKNAIDYFEELKKIPNQTESLMPFLL
jgi:hypothetical protein